MRAVVLFKSVQPCHYCLVHEPASNPRRNSAGGRLRQQRLPWRLGCLSARRSCERGRYQALYQGQFHFQFFHPNAVKNIPWLHEGRIFPQCPMNSSKVMIEFFFLAGSPSPSAMPPRRPDQARPRLPRLFPQEAVQPVGHLADGVCGCVFLHGPAL